MLTFIPVLFSDCLTSFFHKSLLPLINILSHHASTFKIYHSRTSYNSLSRWPRHNLIYSHLIFVSRPHRHFLTVLNTNICSESTNHFFSRHPQSDRHLKHTHALQLVYSCPHLLYATHHSTHTSSGNQFSQNKW